MLRTSAFENSLLTLLGGRHFGLAKTNIKRFRELES